MKMVDELQSRATKAEEELVRVQNELETVFGQASTLSSNKKQLEEDNGVLHLRVSRKNDALNLSRKQQRKAQKLLLLMEERCY